METLLYKIIKTDAQYNKYCNRLEELVDSGKKTRTVQDEIELLDLLIEKYDEEHNSFADADPVELLKTLMNEQKMKAVDLANFLAISKGLVSDILNYKKDFSKEVIRKLAGYFKVSQEAFNRPYPLAANGASRLRKSRVKNAKKRIA